MSATNFNTKNDTYRKLMGNGLTYRIPRFQRDYSWGEDENGASRNKKIMRYILMCAGETGFRSRC